MRTTKFISLFEWMVYISNCCDFTLCANSTQKKFFSLSMQSFFIFRICKLSLVDKNF